MKKPEYVAAILDVYKRQVKRNMNNKLEVIGIDHGWSMMKTISQVFVTGVKELSLIHI